MKDSLLAHAAHEVAEDPKLIRIATITSFIHSVLTFLYLTYIASYIGISLETLSRIRAKI